MTFEEALKLLRQGRVVRRKGWNGGPSIVASNGTLCCMSKEGLVSGTANVHGACIMDDDWEEVVDKERMLLDLATLKCKAEAGARNDDQMSEVMAASKRLRAYIEEQP